MKLASLAVITAVSALTMLGGCANEEPEAEEVDTMGAAIGVAESQPYCETSDGKYRFKAAIAESTVRGAPRSADMPTTSNPLVLSFGREGDKAKTKNDAIVRITHADRSWVELRTTDDIVDGVDARPELLVRRSSNGDRGVSARIKPGDVIDIRANFDVFGPDKSCMARLRVK